MEHDFYCAHFQQKSSLFWPGAIKGSLISAMWTRVRSPHWHTVRFWCVRKSFGHLRFLLKVLISYMETILNIYFTKHIWSPLLNFVVLMSHTVIKMWQQESKINASKLNQEAPDPDESSVQQLWRKTYK